MRRSLSFSILFKYADDSVGFFFLPHHCLNKKFTSEIEKFVQSCHRSRTVELSNFGTFNAPSAAHSASVGVVYILLIQE